MKKILVACFLTLSYSLPSFSATWYVNKNASGTNNGTSWINAFTDLQAAIAATSPGDEIWVAAGTYKPTTTTTRTISFNIPSGVSLYGGFNGTETSLTQRNVVSNLSILTGDIGVIGVALDNSYHVVTMNNVNNQTTLDGFTIINGYANGVGSDNNIGGGLLNIGGSPEIRNCIFAYNYATLSGGALAHKTSGVINLSSSVLNNNYTANFGGALYLAGGTSDLSDCNIFDNQSGSGGACYFYSGAINMDRCIISGNLASGTGGAIYNHDSSIVTISNSLIVGNKADTCAAYYIPMLTNANSHQFINCTIADNKATAVGLSEYAVVINSASTIRNSIVWGNTGTYQIAPVSQNISYNIVEGGVSYNSAPVPGNSTNNPSFVSPGNKNLAPFNASGYDYGLQNSSYAIDYGNNTYVQPQWNFDVVNNARIHGSVVDIGAYEIQYCIINPVVTPGGPFYGCVGTNFTLSGPPMFLSYTWYSTQGGMPVSVVGTTQTITLTPANPGTRIYILKTTGLPPNQCRGTDTVIITIWPTPIPVITDSSGTLVTSWTYSSYQWYFNGVAIANANSSSFTPPTIGNYTVSVTDTNGCTGTSAPYNYNPTGIDELTEPSKLHLHPNPASGYVNIHFNGDGEENVHICLRGINGALIREYALKVNRTYQDFRLDISTLAKGLYLVEMRTENYKQVEKLVVE